ncbi:MAG: proline--tRNA ligase [Candidatus Omnitrophota bacterium]
MRWTQTLIPTMRDVPKDAEALSHQWALRAGLIRQLSSGVYSYLPLGFKILEKVEKIIREEMTKAGAAEVLLPALHPAELWQRSGRYETLGEDKIAFKNRAGHEFVLGPTHEEVITELVGAYVKSFRDLPLTLYQIQTKFRDEARPRFGVIRTKEFIMKDAYSFDKDEAGLDVNYRKMSEAYHAIFRRCGLHFQVVSADPGLMGGKMSQEFMVICPYGEDRVARSEGGYLASLEIAERKKPVEGAPASAASKPEVFDTPNLRTIEEMSSRFKIHPSSMIKTILFIADDRPIAALVTGDSEINENKLRRLCGAKTLRQATAEEILRWTGCPVGFAGPAGLALPIYADWDLLKGGTFVTGANQKDKHVRGIVLGRDFKPTVTGDIRFVKEGDEAPDGSGKLSVTTTMEIGHIFKLGTRYTEVLGTVYVDERGEKKPVIMGCYGIGVNRILAAAIEEHHDERGIVWPEAIAPYAVEIITVNQADSRSRDVAEKIYEACRQTGIEVLYDDRDERAGVKFHDADMIGLPWQVVIGERNLKEGKIEIKSRRHGQAERIPAEDALPFLVRQIGTSGRS